MSTVTNVRQIQKGLLFRTFWNLSFFVSTFDTPPVESSGAEPEDEDLEATVLGF